MITTTAKIHFCVAKLPSTKTKPVKPPEKVKPPDKPKDKSKAKSEKPTKSEKKSKKDKKRKKDRNSKSSDAIILSKLEISPPPLVLRDELIGGNS